MERHAALGVALLVAAALAPPAAAASMAAVTADPATPSATATHTVTVVVDGESAGSSWNGIAVAYPDSDVSNVGVEDVRTVGIDRGNDDPGTTVDTTVGDDLDEVDGSDGGHTLTVALGGNYDLRSGDQLVVVYRDVRNPGAGEHEVGLDVNPQSSGGEATATLTVRDGAASVGLSPATVGGAALAALATLGVVAYRRR